ncbi:sensor domain-containing diguanylate cyclase [Niveibacterium sp. 24ML]|uniref:sensor domain-containing diguanylate cyclase n=1 Tax=Niveibacterium sp. 24ML TaxID=2985512 RepID=UPI00227016DE|nr:sensor domain-containing diguanylate cyclase [Niveibacterium sp. 24ML]MCX9155573.1 sensor domain-containing diguanylate cyclase [Niveibacterium sp. 24ML]
MPTAPTPVDMPLDQRLLVEQVALLGESSRVTSVAGGVAVVVMAATLWSFTASPLVGVWAGLMMLLVLSHVAFHRTMCAPDLTVARAEWLEQLYHVRNVLTGLGWGITVFFVLRPGGLVQIGTVVLIVMTVALASTGTQAANRMSFFTIVLPSLGPPIALLLIQPPETVPLAGGGVLGYLLLLFGLHRAFNRTLLRTLQRRLESEALAREQQVIFDTAAEAIVLVKGPHILKCNRRFLQLMGCSEADVVGSPMWVWHQNADDWQRHSEAALTAMHDGRAYTYVAPLRRRDGSTFQAEMIGMPVSPERPEAGMVWMGSDITVRLETERALRTSEERFRRLVSMSSDLYWEQDAELRFTHLSGAGMDRIGNALHDCMGKRRWEVAKIEGVLPEQWQQHKSQLAAHEAFRDFVFYVSRADGTRIWFSTSGNPIFNENGEFAGYHGIASDISERMRNAERYRHLAYHDPLTGLPNRRLLSDRLEQAIAQAKRRETQVGLMLLDLDDFKIINDSDGHAVGDAVLATIAHRLRLAVRDADTVARVGGDEFVVLLPEVEGPQAAEAVATKVLEAVREPVTSDQRDYLLGVSIGIALYPNHAATGEQLMQRADAAMYRAKTLGGRSAVFASITNKG